MSKRACVSVCELRGYVRECIYVCMCVNACVMYLCVCWACVNDCLCGCVQIYAYELVVTCAHACDQLCMHVRFCKCMRICADIYIYIYIYIYICANSFT